jgi:hypothetical protein
MAEWPESTLARSGHENRFDKVFELLTTALGALNFFFFVVLDRHVSTEMMATFFAFVVVVWHNSSPFRFSKQPLHPS